MFKLFKLFSIFKKKGVRRHNPIMSFVGVLLFTFTLSCFGFLIIDSDFLYYHWFLNDKQVEEFKNNNYIYDENGNIIGMQDGTFSPVESTEYYGLNMMLMNKMAAGYCKDYLTIAEKHSSGEAMMDMPNIKDIDGNQLTVPITHLVGTSVAESGHWGGTAQGIPRSLIKIESYGKSSGSLKAEDMTFYSLNHNSYLKANQSDLYQPYWDDAADGLPTVTTFQINRSYMSLPKGQMTKANGKVISTPSKMNGYGYSESTVRTTDQTDAAFLPDLFSYVICQAMSMASEYPDGVFSADGLVLLSSIQHNSGSAAVIRKTVYGQSKEPSKRLDSTQEKVLTAKYLNELADILQKGAERDNELLFNMNLYEPSTWRSYLAGVMLSEGGYRIGSYCNTSGFNYLTGSQARTDALYLGLTGTWSPNISKDKVKSEWNKYAPLDLAGKYAQGTIDNYGNSGYLYKIHTDTKITGYNGAQVDACTQVNLITLAHMSSVISAKYYICQMMKYSGVDCTPNEIFVVNTVVTGGGTEDPNNMQGTPNTAVREWFIMAAKDVDKGAVANPEKYYGDVYDKMSGFAKLMLTNWYWYTDPSNNKLQGCSYYWGGRCYRIPDDVNPTSAGVPMIAGDNGNSYKSFMSSCVGRTKRYGFDCAGLVRTMTSDVLPNGILASSNSTGITFQTYGSMSKIYGGYYNGQNPLGIGPLFKGAYTFSSSSNFSNIPIQLQPFDILGHSGHILFFICWIDQSAGTMLTLEATDAGQLTGLHSTTIKYSLSGTVGCIQFDHNNAYKYIVSGKRCTNPANNSTEDSSYTTWNSAKNTLASDPSYKGSLKNGSTMNSNYLGTYAQGMKKLTF